MAGDVIQQVELLAGAALGFGRQGGDGRLQGGAGLRGEDVAGALRSEVVLAQGGVEPVLEGRPQVGEGHAGTRQLALVANRSRGKPDGGQGAIVQQGGQAIGIQTIGFVDVAHHHLSFAGVGHEGQAATGFDLIHDPVPVTDRLQGDRGAGRKRLAELADGAELMLEASVAHRLAGRVDHAGERIALMRIQGHLIIGHAAPPVKLVGPRCLQSNRGCCAFM